MVLWYTKRLKSPSKKSRTSLPHKPYILHHFPLFDKPDMSSPAKKEAAIAVSFKEPAMAGAAATLATRLNLELTTCKSPYNYTLMVQATHVELVDTTGKTKPFFIDFNSDTLTYRRQHGGGRKQAVCRAIGLQKNRCPRVIDATAGLGRDSFILAALGCTVTLFERNPILQVLLEDGLLRGRAHKATQGICARMKLISGDIQQYPLPFEADVIYLDPMYPHRRKSSLVKKEMRIIRQLVGNDPDADRLLVFALQAGVKRIVVKRPKKAPHLGDKKPTSCLKEKNSRFDIYLP